jgi:hypothetical protein
MPNTKQSPNLARPSSALLAALLTGLLSVAARANPPEPKPAADASALDARLFFALGMIETGNDDRGVGRGGEVSRYQIHPSVWRNYSDSRDYQNPDVSLQVARQHWSHLTNYFRDKAGREPTPFDMYVLWNTKFGYYARKGFDPARLSSIVRDRAQRFVNLLNR